MDLVENDNFALAEKTLDEKHKDKIIARLLHQDGSYWIYHKNFIDDDID